MTYELTRARLETYFDRTAAETWARLTSEAPVSRIRATVRAGRDRMRAVLLSRLPADMTGLTLLDAGCGVGQLAVEAARRGATVTAVDISPNLLEVARKRLPADVAGRIRFLAGDMLDARLGAFDHVVAMDSLIHYRPADIAAALARLAERTRAGIVFTVAPATPLLAGDALARQGLPPRRPLARHRAGLAPPASRASSRPRCDWRLAPVERVTSGFYISEAMELRP